MTEFKIGDWVWTANWTTVDKEVPCPVCNGNKSVILIFGTGEQVEVECQFCALGYHPPSGVIQVGYEFIPKTQYRKITGIDSRMYDGKLETTYWFSGQGSHEVYETEEEAMQQAIIKAEKAQESHRVKLEEQKYNSAKSYSWNAGYHMEQIERAKHDLEYHMKKAQVMKDQAKKYARKDK